VRPAQRVAAGAVALVVATLPVRRDRIAPTEASVFASVNRLPDRWHRPAWVVMQCGALGAAPVAGGLAWAAGDRRLAARLTLAGSTSWALSKVVKRIIQRDRPSGLLEGVAVRGPAASGLGYLSGHAGVATALALGLVSRVGWRRAAPALAVAGTVGLTRIYVGAHLPLDVAGGAALGLLVEGGIAQLTEGRHAEGRR
jgi:undecaprenyl-diphosphatase